MAAQLECSQCGRAAPDTPKELSAWRHGDLLLAGELDEAAAPLLLCPDCVAEEHEGAFEAGGESE